MASDIKYIDRKLIAQLNRGSHQAFEQLYNLYSQKVFYFSHKFLNSREDAESLTQDVFVKIWEIRETINPEMSFNSYLLTIAKNTIFNQYRKSLNEQAYKEHLRTYFNQIYSPVENDLILKDLSERLNDEIKRFPPVRRRVFELSRIEGYTYKEIASELKLTEKTIETHIRLALKTLKEKFSQGFITIITLWFSFLS